MLRVMARSLQKDKKFMLYIEEHYKTDSNLIQTKVETILSNLHSVKDKLLKDGMKVLLACLEDKKQL